MPQTDSQTDFFKHFDLYVQEKIQEGKAHNYIRRLRSCKNILLKFAAHEQRDGYTFAELDRDFATRFKKYRFDVCGCNINTVAKDMTAIKTVIKDADIEHDKCVNKKYKSKAYKVERINTDSAALRLDEVLKLHKTHIDSKALTRCKDFFVLGCLTGLRFSDWRITSEQIVEMERQGKKQKMLVVINKKTHKRVFIPLHDVALEILKKYNYDLKPPCNQVFNRRLKELGKAIDIFERKIQMRYCIGTEVGIKSYRISERLSSHVARHSFIEIGLQHYGLDTSTLAAITGQCITQMLKYVNNSDVAAAFRFAAYY